MHGLRKAGISIGFGAALVSLSAGPVPAAGIGAVVSHLMIPLTGTFSEPPDPCLTSGESVAFTGNVHVVTILRRDGSLFVHLNLANVTGTGQASGDTYIGVGAHNYPPAPLASSQLALHHDFRLQSTEGCASQPLPITVTLDFSGNGHVEPSPASSATITPTP
jgi:hypothetical protein